MLTNNQIKEIRKHLEKAQNPLFFFDNDSDGLASFLLLRRFCNKGKGVAIKSFPDLNVSYFRKIQELHADYVFVLDKPEISEEFLKELRDNNIPLVWIDHHKINFEKYEKYDLNYFNPIFNKQSDNEPTTYICYNVTDKKDDWIAMIGCIGDGYLPDFVEKFEIKYPELFKKNPKNAFDILYNTEIGKIGRMLNFSLKDRTSNVVKMLKYLIEVKSPFDLLKENSKNKTIYYRFNHVNKKYTKLIERAKLISEKNGKLLFFQYGGDLSLSADIANELCFTYPDKIVVVAYIRGEKANLSLRGKQDMIKLTQKAIEDIEGATGGGHVNATGAQMPVEFLTVFKENLLKHIEW